MYIKQIHDTLSFHQHLFFYAHLSGGLFDSHNPVKFPLQLFGL